MSQFFSALMNLGIPADVAAVVDGQFAKVEQNSAALAGVQAEVQQLGVQVRAMQL